MVPRVGLEADAMKKQLKRSFFVKDFWALEIGDKVLYNRTMTWCADENGHFISPTIIVKQKKLFLNLTVTSTDSHYRINLGF